MKPRMKLRRGPHNAPVADPGATDTQSASAQNATPAAGTDGSRGEAITEPIQGSAQGSSSGRGKGRSAAKPSIPKKVVCPISGTVFNPRTTGGRCPVCGEQVVPKEVMAGATPLASPAGKWLFQEGNWRLVALITLIVYQLVLFGLLWHHLAVIHAL